MSPNRRVTLIAAWIAVVLGAAEFLLRGILRGGLHAMSDFSAPYVSALLWRSGANPYDSHAFLPAWYASGAVDRGLSEFISGTHSVYPPMTLPLVAPFTLLHWNPATTLFLALAILLYFLVLFGSIRLAWPHHRGWSGFAADPRAVFFLAFALAFAPIHTALVSENLVIAAACMAILAILLLLKAFPALPPRTTVFLAAAAIILAICLKPTTGVFLLPWLLWERRWRMLAAIVAGCALVTAIGMAPLLASHGTAWLDSYRANIDFLFTNGGNADVSPANYARTDRIDLQLVLFALTASRTASTAIAFLVYAALLAAFFAAAGRFKDTAAPSGTPLLVAAGSLALGMLAVYTRVYSALALLPLVLWCFRHLDIPSGRWLLVLLCDFLVNSGAFIRRSPRLQVYAHRSPRLWDATIGGHTCWILLAIGILAVVNMRQRSRIDPPTLSS